MQKDLHPHALAHVFVNLASERMTSDRFDMITVGHECVHGLANLRTQRMTFGIFDMKTVSHLYATVHGLSKLRTERMTFGMLYICFIFFQPHKLNSVSTVTKGYKISNCKNEQMHQLS